MAASIGRIDCGGGAAANVLDTREMDAAERLFAIALGADRVFMTTYEFCSTCTQTTTKVNVFSGWSAGQIQSASVTLAGGEYGYISELVPDGTRAVLLGNYPRRVMLVDAKNATAPTLTTVAKHALSNDYYGYPASVIGDTLVIPRGPYGVEQLDLTP